MITVDSINDWFVQNFGALTLEQVKGWFIYNPEEKLLFNTGLFLGLFLVFLTVSLNMIFIPLYGLNGAAIATLISITLYSLAKLLFVVLKMELFPFTKNTIVALVLAMVSFGVFYYWDFGFHLFINIILKSILVTIFYLGLSYYLKISSDINFVMNSIFKRILKK